MGTIKISLNDQAKQLPTGAKLAQALLDWGYQCEKIAVAVNGDFVPRSQYQQYVLCENDSVDVVAPVQGG